MSEIRPLALIAGAGVGLGAALMARFQSGGYQAVGLARQARETRDGSEIVAVDLTEADRVADVVSRLTDRLGPPSVVIHNPAKLIIAPFAETSVEEFERAWRAMALSAAILAGETLPLMAAQKQGAFLVSGATASLRGGARFSAFASAKFALRGLTQSLAREFQSQGVHVAHVILDGIVDTVESRALHGLDPRRMMNPADIADAYWHLAHQPQSTWTHELDLRPMSEAF